MAKPASPTPFADTDPSVYKWMSAGRRVVSVRVAAMIRADGRAMLSWWSSTSSPKWMLDRSIHGGGLNVESSTAAVSMSARLAISSAVSHQLDFLGHWAWDLVRRPGSPLCKISTDRLAACEMEVSWQWRRALSCSLAVAILAWSASDSKFDSLMKATTEVDLVQPVIIRAPAQCWASSFMRLSVLVSRPGTVSRSGKIETLGFHHMTAESL